MSAEHSGVVRARRFCIVMPFMRKATVDGSPPVARACPHSKPGRRAEWPRAAAWLLLGALATVRAAPPGGEEAVSFHRQVQPILRANCQGCHQPAKAKGGYALTDFARLMQPGDEGRRPVVPGHPDDSYLVQQISPRNGEASMPRGQPPLAEREIELVRRWIAEGARNDTPAAAERSFDASHPPVYSRAPAVVSLDFSADGAWLAVAGFHEVLLHRADGTGIEARLVGLSERVQSVRFSPDGTLLAVAGGQPARMGELQVWDVAQRKLRISVPVGHDTLYGVNWSPDGRWVSFGCPDKTVRAIEAATGKQVLQQMAHEDWVLETVFSTNGSHVVSVGRDMTAKLTEVATQRFVDNLTSITPGALRGGLQTVARHPFRDEVLVGGADGRPQVYQVFRQAPRRIGDNAALLRQFPETQGRIFSADYSPDGKRIATASSLDGRGSVDLFAAEFDPAIPAAVLKAYEKTSAEYSAEERAAIEKFTTAEVKRLHRVEVSEAPVYALAFSPDGRRVAAGTGAGRVLLIEVETGHVLTHFASVPVEAAPTPAPAPAPAIEVSAGTPIPQSAPEPPSDLSGATGLEVFPNRIQLTHRNEHVQLVVMATVATGEVVDATRQATYEVDGDLGVVSAQGQFTGQRAGVGTLRVSVGDRAVELPLDLSAFAPVFPGDFIRDVSPVLARLGCNAGTCHGSKEGKNGFKLSLRGYDPVFDVRALTDDLASRRVNPAAPDESLMLLKATGAVPHAGGQRTPHGSEYYAILRQWIAEGARLDGTSARVTRLEVAPANPIVQPPGGRQQMRVLAAYADGRTRDVTAEAFLESGNPEVATADPQGLLTAVRRGEAPILARYEGAYAATTLTVMGDRTGFVWQDPPVNNRIDELVAAKWKRLKILPSGLCSDAEFIRRVSLDLTGLPPTAAEVVEFLANPRDPRSKRDALIERLLGSAAFLDHWANKWADLLQVNRRFLGEEGARLFRDWIRAELAANTPYDDFVRRVLTASGSNRDNPAASYWKIQRTPTEAMENTTHLFLATRFNCNKCHDHPFERWTQDQYYALAQYFAQFELKKDEASGDRRVAGTEVEGARPLFELVSDRPEGSIPHERTGKPAAPAFPYPAGSAPASEIPRRQALAAWLTSADNRYFALSYVNRLWGYLLGVGLIEPLDDLRAGNPPSNPELLEHLTREFVESGFNSRHIVRQICQSRTYQLELATHRWNADDQVNFSHALPRRLPAEVLFDAVYRVTGTTPDFPGTPAGTRAAQWLDPAVDTPNGFLATLGRPPRESACECERSNDLKLSSVMALVGSAAVSRAIGAPGNALAQLVAHEADDRKVANELFLRVLNRPAGESELSLVAAATATLEQAHVRLANDLAAAEARWAERRPVLEAQRAAAIARAEKALADHLASRAPEWAAAQRERSVRIATTEAAVKEYGPILEQRLIEWEQQVARDRFATVWAPLDPTEVRGAGSAQLRKLPDGSVRSTASVGELPSYTVVARTGLTNLTGVKLEALPDAELPNYGPGHKDGDFLLAEFQVEFASPTNANNFTRAKLVQGTTDRPVDGFPVEHLYNGIVEQGRLEGWRIGAAAGRPHWAAFGLEAPILDTNGVILRFTLHHRYEAPYELGRFRLWVTTNAAPAAEGLPAGLAEVLNTPAAQRTAPQSDLLRAYFRGQDPEMLRRDFDRVLARKPLPEDEQRQALELELARVCRPVPLDPSLAQLREDVAASTRQREQKRLTAVQDLTWALINTPAFLFNH